MAVTVVEPPLLARWFAPAGPARPERRCAGGTAVHSIPGRYSVTQIIEGPRALTLVDVGSRADLEGLARVVRRLRKPVRWVLATHLHFDHVWGIEAACRRFGVPLRLGEVALAHVRSGRRPRGVRWHTVPYFFPSWLWQGLPLPARADLAVLGRVGSPLTRNAFRCPLGPVLRDGQSLSGFPGWRVLATPGHADEAICLWHQRAGFLVAGDTVRNFRGGEWNPLVTDPVAYRQTIARLRRLPIKTIFPAHGPNITQSERIGRLLGG